MFENDEYFKESIIWYNDMFISRFVERIIFIVLMLIILLVALIFGLYIFSYEMPPSEFIVVSDMPREVDDGIKIRKLLNTKTTNSKVTESITEYMIKNYIDYRESYRMYSIEAQKKFVKEHSYYKIFKDFESELDPSNKDSEIMKISGQVIIYSTIDNLELKFDTNMILSSALAYVNKIYILNNKVLKKIRKKITIDFSIADIILVGEGVVPFSFTVTNYRSIDAGSV